MSLFWTTRAKTQQLKPNRAVLLGYSCHNWRIPIGVFLVEELRSQTKFRR
ncbi:hypothetical protein AVDCRST_MAG84-6259 [uncultured Microcoleus sp.]|uniref:Uncharacterized protein n=1 Tax=uncultured Microcoleus sp. TaxID=259945 RepID=A0A6J4P8T3_9CYAN|nr:hypothetical protein AVDCRST_MAG84-6259 [uncultured Microcoleus sp.]